MRTARNDLRVVVWCAALALAWRAGAQPVVVAELRIASPSFLERTATLASPAAVRGLEDRWVAAAQDQFGFVTWKRAPDAPAGTPRLILRMNEEPSQGCLPGRLTMTLTASVDGSEDTHRFSPGRDEFKGPCDPEWQDASPEAFAQSFQDWLTAAAFAGDMRQWIQDALLSKIKLADKIVAEDKHLFLPVKARDLRASRASEIYVRFGQQRVDGYAYVHPVAGEGDLTQVLITAFTCGETVSSSNITADRAGPGVVWHPQLAAVLEHCQFPAAFMLSYEKGNGESFAPPAPAATNLPTGGTALNPDGRR